MDFGFSLGGINPRNYPAVAAKAEACGFTVAWQPEHLIWPAAMPPQYPYSADGLPGVTIKTPSFDAWVNLALCASTTTRLRLGSAVYILPLRHPLITARSVATLDFISRGRAILGIGVGWLEEEIAALGGPPYKERGTASDAYIRAFRELWSSANPKGDGTYAKLDDLMFEPKPVQRPGPPIWVGGESRAARRRAGQLGDGWYPSIRNPGYPLDRAETFAAGLADVRQIAEAAGRDPAALDVAVMANGLSLGKSRNDADGRRSSFTGSPDQVAEDALAYAAAGVRHIIISFETNDLSFALDQIEAFARDVMPKAKR